MTVKNHKANKKNALPIIEKKSKINSDERHQRSMSPRKIHKLKRNSKSKGLFMSKRNRSIEKAFQLMKPTRISISSK